MQIEPWQIPVVVMAALAALTIPASLHSLVKWVRRDSSGSSSDPESAETEQADTERTARRERSQSRWTKSFATATVALFGVTILAALGPEAATRLTAVASAVSAVAAAAMTIESYLELGRIRREVHGDPPQESTEARPG